MNEAQLNFVSLRSAIHYVGWKGRQGSRWTPKAAPLTALPTQKWEVCLRSLLTGSTTS